MTAKDIIYRDDSRGRLMHGVELLAAAVRVTLGPRGRNVVLEQGSGAPRSTKDGVTVAREIELESHCANIGAMMLREVAGKVNDEAGDGTTTAVVLGHAIAREGVKAVTVGLNPMEVKRGIDAGIAAAIDYVEGLSRPVETRDSIHEVALVASNGDDPIANLIAEAFDRVGRDGAITIEQGQTIQTELDVTDGMRFDRGYISPYFVTDPEKMICELQQPRILLHAGKIDTLHPLLPLLEAVATKGVPLLIVAEEVAGEALATLIVNKVRGGLKLAAVTAPGYGDRRTALLDDIAALAGTTTVRDELGMKLDSLDIDQLGRAETVRITKDETVIVTASGRDEVVAARTAEIRRAIAEADSDFERNFLEGRLAALSGGVAVLRVGGNSETEAKERKDRVDDALNAVRAAAAEGVVIGGGVALLDAGKALDHLMPVNHEQKVGIDAVRRALEVPVRQIAENAGFAGSVIAGKLRERKNRRIGFDARTGGFVDMFEAGIVDPTRVVRAALRCGGSVAGLLVTTEAVIAEHVDREIGTEMDPVATE